MQKFDLVNSRPWRPGKNSFPPNPQSFLARGIPATALGFLFLAENQEKSLNFS
jgi:hypothetical protein